jgi:hypothetical protein
LTGVKHMGREISTRGELGTDSLRSNSSGTSWLQVDRMESSEAGAAQLYGGGGGGGCGGSAGIGQEANRHGAGCEGMPEIAAVTAKAEDVQLGKFDSAGVKIGDGPHGVDTCNVAVVEAGDAAGLGKEIWPRGGLHAGLEQESKTAGVGTDGHLKDTGGQLPRKAFSWGWRPNEHAFGACNNSGCQSILEHSPYRCNELVICGACGMVMPTARRNRSGDAHQSRDTPQYWSRVGLPADDSAPRLVEMQRASTWEEYRSLQAAAARRGMGLFSVAREHNQQMIAEAERYNEVAGPAVQRTAPQLGSEDTAARRRLQFTTPQEELTTSPKAGVNAVDRADAHTSPRTQRSRRVLSSPVPLALPVDVVQAASADAECSLSQATVVQPAPLGSCARRWQRWQAAVRLQSAARRRAALRQCEGRLHVQRAVEEPAWLVEAHRRVAVEHLQRCWRGRLQRCAQGAVQAAVRLQSCWRRWHAERRVACARRVTATQARQARAARWFRWSCERRVQAVVRLQSGWRRHRAQQRAARARRVAAAQARLAARELEERAKRDARQVRAAERAAARAEAERATRDARQARAAERATARASAQQAAAAVARATEAAVRLQRAARLAAVTRAERQARDAAAEAEALAERAVRFAGRARQLKVRHARARQARRKQRAALMITAAMRRLMWRRWRRRAMAAEAEGAGEEADSADAEQLGPQTPAEAAGMWEAVFQAQAALAAQLGVDWHEQIERNTHAMRLRLERERQRREERELGMAFAEGWGVRVAELRLRGVRLPMGAGSGGRQQRSRRERQQAAEAG